jgi:pimeloyl-ACP methyl ester carboxylesterase
VAARSGGVVQHAGPKLRFARTVLGTGPKVHYAEQGHPEGEVIVLFHGWSDSWCSFSPVLAMLPTPLPCRRL